MKLKYSKVQVVIEIVAGIILIYMFVNLFLKWDSIPNWVPTHYNIYGEIDAWGDKNNVLFVPIMGAGIYAIMTMVTLFPSIWNMPVTITESNKGKVYGAMKTMLLLLKAEILGLFLFMNYNVVSRRTLSPYFLIIAIGIVAITIIYIVAWTIRISKS